MKVYYSMGRLPRGSRLGLGKVKVFAEALVYVAVFVLVVVFVEPNEFEDSPDVPALALVFVDFRRLLYLTPGYPGLVGSSRVSGFRDSITTTRRMFGRNCGSD